MKFTTFNSSVIYLIVFCHCFAHKLATFFSTFRVNSANPDIIRKFL